MVHGPWLRDGWGPGRDLGAPRKGVVNGGEGPRAEGRGGDRSAHFASQAHSAPPNNRWSPARTNLTPTFNTENSFLTELEMNGVCQLTHGNNQIINCINRQIVTFLV